MPGNQPGEPEAGILSGPNRRVSATPNPNGHQGLLDWRLLGLLRVAHEEGPDVARSAAGRAAGEAIWLPTTLLPHFGVRWEAPDEDRLTARLSVHGLDTVLHLRPDDHGHLASVHFDRWGDPDHTGSWGPHVLVTGSRGRPAATLRGDPRARLRPGAPPPHRGAGPPA